jgi:general stress protein 26
MSATEIPLPPDVLDFVRNNPRTFLISRRKDGSPTGHPMLCLIGDGRIQFSTYRKSVKVQNFQRDPTAACLATTKHDDPAFNAALVRGQARVREGLELPMRETPQTSSWVSTGVSSRSKERLATGKRIILEIVATEAAPLADVRKKR